MLINKAKAWLCIIALFIQIALHACAYDLKIVGNHELAPGITKGDFEIEYNRGISSDILHVKITQTVELDSLALVDAHDEVEVMVCYQNAEVVYNCNSLVIVVRSDGT